MHSYCKHTAVGSSTGWNLTPALENTAHSAFLWAGIASHSGPQTGHPHAEQVTVQSTAL